MGTAVPTKPVFVHHLRRGDRGAGRLDAHLWPPGRVVVLGRVAVGVLRLWPAWHRLVRHVVDAGLRVPGRTPVDIGGREAADQPVDRKAVATF